MYMELLIKSPLYKKTISRLRVLSVNVPNVAKMH